MNHKKAIFAAMIGNALEYYDVMLYGFFAATLAPLFFPTTNHFVSITASLGTFAAGFLMRPLGGILFGHLGDRYGRRMALAFSILLVTLPTLTIGLLPTYEYIGIAAPIILVVCRLLQGLCVGGEYSGAAIFVIEHSKKKKEAFAGSVLCATGFLGGFLGTILGLICTLPYMPTWSWRIPFLIGSIIGLIGYYIRTQVDESPAYSQAMKRGEIIKSPLRDVIQNRTRNLFCTIGIGAMALVPLYLVTVYLSTLLKTELHVETSQIMLLNTMVTILWMVTLPCMGYLADKFGTVKIMSISCLSSLLLAYPLFYILETNLSVYKIIFVQILLSIVGASFSGPATTLLTKLFHVNERYSGIGFGYALGGAILGGTTPLIATTLVRWSSSPVAPSFYLMVISIIGFLSVNYAQKEAE
jgi:MHS family proline/betaine transporter-like MFS transporter